MSILIMEQIMELIRPQRVGGGLMNLVAYGAADIQPGQFIPRHIFRYRDSEIDVEVPSTPTQNSSQQNRTWNWDDGLVEK
jgi:hypothetical protein